MSRDDPVLPPVNGIQGTLTFAGCRLEWRFGGEMKEGFCFGLGMMIGLLTPAVLILVVMSIAVGLRDWLLSRKRKKQESRSGGPESSKLLIFQTEQGTQHTERTKYSRAVAP
jgi:hypothetical protein